MLEKIHSLLGKPTAKKWEERILAELRFACILSKEHDNRYDDRILETEKYICEAVRKSQIITQEIVLQAEKMLEPLAALAKSYQVLCVAHAHIDMNWQWGYDETTAVVIDTFRTMLDIMEEYPDYKFSQSQASVYKIVEDHCPPMLEEIKRRIHEGRWEVTASTWVENDTNMPTGESLARQILYTKQYLSNLLDISPDTLNLSFQPDTFGHNIQLPELLSQSGVSYYYHCRGRKDGPPLFRWRSPSGAEVLVYREHNFYNSFIGTDVAEQAVELARLTGNKTVLRVYGVGDHGGGPTRRDIEKILMMNCWPIYPAFKCSTFREYFESVEKAGCQLPVEETESNFIFDGCYTSQSIIKQANRTSERLLYESELMSAFSTLSTGHPYDYKGFTNAWQKTLFNQFHDILTGSCVQASREFAMGEYQKVSAIATTNKKLAAQAIMNKIDTSQFFETEEITALDTQADGAGSGCSQNSGGAMGKTRVFHVVNTADHDLTDLCEIFLWDYEGDLNYVQIRDSSGQPCQFQVIGKGDCCWHYYTKLLVEVTVPACGYETLILSEQVQYDFTPHYAWEMRVQEEQRFVLENEKIKVVFHPQNAMIQSIVDKETGTELVDSQRSGAGICFIDEVGRQPVEGFSSMNSWFVGRYKSFESLHRNVDIKTVLNGELRNAIQIKTAFRNSNLTIVVSLDKNSTHLDFSVTCDWREFGSEATVPSLCFFLPVLYECKTYAFDIPFGIKDRGERDIDQPANSFVRAKGAGVKDLMLISKDKYGYRCLDNSIGLKLIRGTSDPDKTPEIGMHQMEFCIQVLDSSATGQTAVDAANTYCHPLQAYAGKRHSGTMPARQSYLRQIDKGVVISGVKMSEDGKSLIIRLYETEGHETTTRLQLFRAPTSACFVDTTEKKELDGCVKTDGNILTISLAPFHVATVKVDFSFCKKQ